MWYALLATIGVLFVVGLLGSEGDPGVGAIVLFIGLPVAIYLVFRKQRPSEEDGERVITTTVEIRSSVVEPKPRAINVGSSSYSLPKRTRQKFRFLSKSNFFE